MNQNIQNLWWEGRMAGKFACNLGINLKIIVRKWYDIIFETSFKVYAVFFKNFHTKISKFYSFFKKFL